MNFPLITNYQDTISHTTNAKMKEVNIPLKIGFDKIKVSVHVVRVDWNTLDEMISESKNLKSEIKVSYVNEKEEALAICQDQNHEHLFKSIIIIRNNNKLSIRKCNIPNCRDICVLEVCIPPMNNHEVLGNINNLNAEDEKARVREIMHTMENYGIYLDPDSAIIKEAEININICYNGYEEQFERFSEVLRPFRIGLNGCFIFSDYSQPSTSDMITMSIGTKKGKTTINSGIKKTDKTSFNAQSNSIKIKVYDKSREVIDKSKGAIASLTSIYRIEFAIMEPNEIPVYLSKNNLFDITQDNLESAFHKLAERFIKKPLETYYNGMNRLLEEYFGSINVKERDWRKKLIMTIDKILVSSDAFLIISIDELNRYVSYIPSKSIKKNRSSIVKSLISEFQNSSCVRISETDICGELINMLCSHTGSESQNLFYFLS